MLVLSRKLYEQIKIGDDITVTVTHISGSHVKLAVEAPRSVVILRKELYDHDSLPELREDV